MGAFTRRLQSAPLLSDSEETPETPTTLLAPDYVTVTGGDAKVTLWWTTVKDATGYDVEYRESPAGAWMPMTHNGTVTQSTVLGLVNGTGYDLRVRSKKQDELSPWTEAPDTVIPVAATNTGAGLPLNLETVLVNQSSTSVVYAYVVGLDLTNGRWTIYISATHARSRLYSIKSGLRNSAECDWSPRDGNSDSST